MAKVCIVSSQVYCKSNSILSSRLIRYFAENDYLVTKKISEADLIVVNTCGFTEYAEEISIKSLTDVIRNKKEESRVACVGCLNKINKEKIKHNLNGVYIIDSFTDLDSLIIAHKPYHEIITYSFRRELFDQIGCVESSLIHAIFLKFIRHFQFLLRSFDNRRYLILDCRQINQIIDEEYFTNKLYVQISSGCASNCSYCVIKKARGEIVSRSIGDIVSDIKETYKEGMVLNLVADDCGSYGVDIRETLFNLINAIDKEFPKVPIDLCYINPRWLEQYTNEYIEMFKKYNINSINISLQSGSDRLLTLMNRRYRIKNILNIIKQIKKISPLTLIWGHFLVDYPSETWRDFYFTLKAALHLHYYYVFVYSPRKKTKCPEEGNGSSKYDLTLKKIILFIMLGCKIFIYPLSGVKFFMKKDSNRG